jgi:hypothetical protein
VLQSPSVGQSADPHVFLSGRPPLPEFLGFVTSTVGGDAPDVGALAEGWRKANDHVEMLRSTEPTYADDPPIGELPENLAALGEAVVADPIVQRTFSLVPFKLGMVELDRLVVWQKLIDLAHIARLRERLGPTPSDEDVFRLALPIDRQLDPPIASGIVAPNTWAFSCESNDLRVLDAKLIDASTVDAVMVAGAARYLVAAVVGFGSNMLSAICAERRLVLNNGSHRAYTLREAGITHAPCLIQMVSRRDELPVVASGDLAASPDAYLVDPRPPVLRDYFDDALRVVAPVARKQRQVRVQINVEQVDVATG